MSGTGYTPPHPAPDAIHVPEGALVEFLTDEQWKAHNEVTLEYGWPNSMIYPNSAKTNKPMLVIVCKRCGLGHGLIIVYRDSSLELRKLAKFYLGIQGTT